MAFAGRFITTWSNGPNGMGSADADADAGGPRRRRTNERPSSSEMVTRGDALLASTLRVSHRTDSGLRSFA